MVVESRRGRGVETHLGRLADALRGSLFFSLRNCQFIFLSFFLSFFLFILFLFFFFLGGGYFCSGEKICRRKWHEVKHCFKNKNSKKCLYVHYTDWSPQWVSMPIVTRKFTDFPVCVIRYIFIRKLSHLTISSPFILISQKMHENHSGFQNGFC